MIQRTETARVRASAGAITVAALVVVVEVVADMKNYSASESSAFRARAVLDTRRAPVS
jgi:hypothetical protein